MFVKTRFLLYQSSLSATTIAPLPSGFGFLQQFASDKQSNLSPLTQGLIFIVLFNDDHFY